MTCVETLAGKKADSSPVFTGGKSCYETIKIRRERG